MRGIGIRTLYFRHQKIRTRNAGTVQDTGEREGKEDKGNPPTVRQDMKRNGKMRNTGVGRAQFPHGSARKRTVQTRRSSKFTTRAQYPPSSRRLARPGTLNNCTTAKLLHLGGAGAKKQQMGTAEKSGSGRKWGIVLHRVKCPKMHSNGIEKELPRPPALLPPPLP